MTASHFDHDAFERALLGSAKDDAPTSESVERAWSHLSAGLTAGLIVTPPIAIVGAAKLGWLRIAGWITVGAVAGSGLTYGAVHRVASTQDARSISHPAMSVSHPSVLAAVPVPARVQDDAPSSAVAHAQERIVAARPRPASGKPSTPLGRVTEPEPIANAAPSAKAEPPSTLSAEIATLDAARSALDHGATTDTLLHVERYRSAFPHGVLAQEAALLAIEALLAQHDEGRLVQEADAFLRHYPDSPSAARVRRLRDAAAHSR